MGEREGGENFAKFPKVMQTFFTYIDFFSGPLFLACLPDREGMRKGGGWGGCSLAYIFRTCFGTFVMTGSNWVLSKLYIILHNIFFGSSSCARVSTWLRGWKS